MDIYIYLHSDLLLKLRRLFKKVHFTRMYRILQKMESHYYRGKHFERKYGARRMADVAVSIKGGIRITIMALV